MENFRKNKSEPMPSYCGHKNPYDRNQALCFKSSLYEKAFIIYKILTVKTSIIALQEEIAECLKINTLTKMVFVS